MNTALWTSILLTAIIVFGVWVGIPLWMVLRHPDRKPGSMRDVPEYLRMRVPVTVPRQRAAARQGSPAGTGSK